jgi:hypothetical protein
MPLQNHEKWMGISDSRLDHESMGSGWIMFRSFYWAIYAMSIVFTIMYFAVEQMSLTVQILFGVSFVILAVMLLLYGFAELSHRRLMRKYG